MIMSGVLALALTGCGEDAPPPPPPPRPAAPPPAAVAPAASTGAAEAPAAAPYVYNYNPVGKRDPFRSPLEELGPNPNTPGPVTPCNEPLCQWDIDQLKLVAVVTGDANPLAMVEDPMGRGHIVRRNTKVGRQGGKVTQILRDKVVVTEVISTPERVIQNPVEIRMKADTKLEAPYDLIRGKPWEP
jgi:type IV pilus assembly protein PilP